MEMQMSVSLAIFGTIAFLAARRILSRKGPPLPPGPPSDPVLGHLRSIPPSGQDMFFYELGKKYGSVIHLSILGRSLVILNSIQAASDLLEKRSSNYSDRPSLPIFELLGVGDILAFLPYGEEFRLQRKQVQQYFAKEKCRNFRLTLTREARILARDLLSQTHKDCQETLLRFSTAVIMDISYGHQIVSSSDPYLQIASDACRATVETGPPGATPVDLFPFLRSLPSWFPGTYYATYARKTSVVFKRLFEYPFEQVTKEMANGMAKPSFLASRLEVLRQEGLENDPRSIKRAQVEAAVTYIAGAETTSTTLSFFILAMVLYPECVTKAQEEIDRVVGTDRLPEYNDRENLPWLEWILQETLRWHHAIPSGVPHKTMQDDVYNGMFIPKGSTIIANARSMTLDESIYKDPFKFDPERYRPAPLGRGEPYSPAPFGFGRRVCPGRYLANESIWIAIATIMATMSISRAIGNDGNEIIPEVNIVSGITCHPTPFPCRFIPRANMSNLLMSTDSV